MNTYIHEALYRGDDLFNRIADLSLTVCGAGAIGSNLVENLTRQGFKKITVIDFDRVEDHNRHTQVWGRRDVGQLKVRALQAKIYNETGVSITPVHKRLDARNARKLIAEGSLVIDGFDNSESRRIVYEHCKTNKLECLHIGLEGGYAEVIWNEDYRVPKDGALDVCEYPLARNIVMLSAIVGTEVILRYLENGTRKNYTITLGDLKVEQL